MKPAEPNGALARAGNVSSEAVFEMLRILSRADRPLGVADLHRLTGEPTSSVHRAISTLEEAGFAARYQGSARFIPGRMSSHLIRALINRYTIGRTARPYLARLVDVTGGGATLNVRLGWYSVRLLSVDGRMEYVETRRIGQPRYLHQDLAPLTILCFLREIERDRYAAFAARETGVSESRLDLRGLVRSVMRDGYAVRQDAAQKDRAWAGFPLFNPDGKVVASIALSAAVEPRALLIESPLLQEITATIGSLQYELSRDPAKSAAPFAGIDPDAIRLRGNAQEQLRRPQ